MKESTPNTFAVQTVTEQASRNEIRRKTYPKMGRRSKCFIASPSDLDVAKNDLLQMGLDSVVVGDYLVVVKRELDATIDGQPYIVLMLLFNQKSGAYIARIWNETVTEGRALNMKELTEACRKHFCQRKPCTGCPIDGDDETRLRFFPLRRKFSKSCHKLLRSDDDEMCCAECAQLANNVISADVECKVEIKSDEEETLIQEQGGVENFTEEYELKHVVKSGHDFIDDHDAWHDDLDDTNALDTNAKDLGEDEKGSDHQTIEEEEDEWKMPVKKKSRAKRKSAKDQVEKPAPKQQQRSDKVKCTWCPLMFFTNSIDYYAHKKSKHFWGEFRCCQCEFVADFAKELTEHVAEKRHAAAAADDPFVSCPNCEWKTPLPEIERHYEACVSAETVIKCEVCDFKHKKRRQGGNSITLRKSKMPRSSL